MTVLTFSATFSCGTGVTVAGGAAGGATTGEVVALDLVTAGCVTTARALSGSLRVTLLATRLVSTTVGVAEAACCGIALEVAAGRVSPCGVRVGSGAGACGGAATVTDGADRATRGESTVARAALPGVESAAGRGI